jgi:hypothetical protein
MLRSSIVSVPHLDVADFIEPRGNLLKFVTGCPGLLQVGKSAAAAVETLVVAGILVMPLTEHLHTRTCCVQAAINVGRSNPRATRLTSDDRSPAFTSFENS